MYKRGQVETVILGVILVCGLIVAGVYSSSELLTEHRFVGDKSKNESYDLAKCIVNIEQPNLIIFNSREEAENGYNLRECN
jgi:hypothetical protein